MHEMTLRAKRKFASRGFDPTNTFNATIPSRNAIVNHREYFG